MHARLIRPGVCVRELTTLLVGAFEPGEVKECFGRSVLRAQQFIEGDQAPDGVEARLVVQALHETLKALAPIGLVAEVVGLVGLGRGRTGGDGRGPEFQLTSLARLPYPPYRLLAGQSDRAVPVAQLRGVGERLPHAKLVVVEGEPRYNRLFVLDAESGKKREVKSGDREIWDYNWSPDSSQLVYTTSEAPNEDEPMLRGDVWIVGADGEEPRHIAELDQTPFSPQLVTGANGPAIAVRKNGGRAHPSESVFLIDLASGAAVNLLEDDPSQVDGVFPLADETAVAIYTAEGVHTNLYRFDLVTGAVAGVQRVRNPISWLSRWKIVDNLRRSVVPTALLALLGLGWATPGLAGPATLVVLAILVLPGLLVAAALLTRRPGEVTLRRHVREIGRGLGSQLAREAFALACLPHEALVGVSAIGHALTRVWVTGRKLLEWRTASDAQRGAATGLGQLYTFMAIAPIAGLAALVGLALTRPAALAWAAPVALAWLLAPALAWRLGRPSAPESHALAAADLRFLRGVARRTWRFFETFIADEDNHLPPDNFQVDPPQGIAHRTSPTNIGLALTANLAAYDFGYLAADEVLARCTRTMAAIVRWPSVDRPRSSSFTLSDCEATCVKYCSMASPDARRLSVPRGKPKCVAGVVT